jgi:hypothetical protein
MAEDNTTIANITPAFFEKYIMAKTLPQLYTTEGFENVNILGPTKNWKVENQSANIVEFQPPYVRKVTDEIPMIIDYVDSNIKPVHIELEDGSTIESLKLTPNPESLVISSSKIVNRYNTMTRWVEEHWGDDLDSINFSGSTYSFNFKLNPNDPKYPNQYKGLTVLGRSVSESYQFLRALINIYRINGYLYQEDNGYTMSNSPSSEREVAEFAIMNRYLNQNPSFIGNHPRRGMIRERLYNRISFDYVTFLGHFESFDITEDSANPYRLIYSTVFKSEKTIWTIG